MVRRVALVTTRLVLFGSVLAQEGGSGSSAGLSAISGALSASETEIRSGVYPAVVGVLTAILVIGIAAAVVRVISRNN